MKLADPTLLKSQCLVDGAGVGEGVDPNQQSGDRGADRQGSPLRPRRDCPRDRGGREGVPAPGRKSCRRSAAILRRWFDLIVADRDDLGLIMTSEQGKPLAEARGEADYAAGFVEWFGEEAKRVYGETTRPSRADSRHPRPQAADRRRRRDHAVEFPRLR